jgi:hypothetical protein
LIEYTHSQTSGGGGEVFDSGDVGERCDIQDTELREVDEVGDPGVVACGGGGDTEGAKFYYGSAAVEVGAGTCGADGDCGKPRRLGEERR